MKLVSLIVFVLITAILLLPGKTVADGSNCLPLLNGGLTSQQYCQSPTPTITPVNNTVQQTSGQTVYPSPKSTSTPNTGPNDWVLPTLVLLGGAGLLLRKKAV